MSNKQDKVPLQGAEMTLQPVKVQYIAATPQQAEAVYIHSLSSVRLEDYQWKLSIVFGIILIVFQTVSIALNIVGFVIQHERSGGGGFLPNGNYIFYLFPALWCGIFVYVSGGLAIGAGKTRKRGVIIAHLVLACIAAVFSFTCLLCACGAVTFDAGQELDSARDKASLGLSIIWLPVCLLVFILVMWCAGLCCRVLCCGRVKEVTNMEIVTPINSPTK